MASKLYHFQQQDLKSRDILVSVVTPFYNTADHLEECILSIIGQTHSRWEYILADNCSVDGSLSIAEKYAALDQRIRVIKETEFLSQVENYNRALRYISPKSKYCKIVQADDLMYPHCLEEMIAVAESGDNVGLVSSFCLYGNCPGQTGLPLSHGPIYPGHDVARAQLYGTMLFGSPTGVMYLSDIVRSHDPFYSTTTLYFEDTDICFEILRDYDFGFVPQILTYSRRDNNGTWAKLEPYNPLILYDIMFIHLVGPDFLNREELIRRIREVESRYYRFLARCALLGYGKDFWEFHRNGLESVGLKLSYRRVAYHAILIIADKVLNPKHSFEMLWSKDLEWHAATKKDK
jgi:glycosyltransferase involved in cell wall biosynthesis